MPGTAVTVTGFKSKNFSAHHFQCVYIVDPRIMQLKLLRIAKIMVVRKNYYEEATETYIGCYREVVEVNAGIVDSYEGCKMLCRNEVTSYIALHIFAGHHSNSAPRGPEPRPHTNIHPSLRFGGVFPGRDPPLYNRPSQGLKTRAGRKFVRALLVD
ncbi:hypothetical protein HELRODRAFT_178961 [Helobdella robusta]|uniref:Uncharacterized protein n=1 Tax=Helobdella robusta TaxID=6412 RepID=T1FDZ1_HELRO|nr:hypothetical protein HELRODRAFT_178961 [Helobdella robusta]ESN95780.1 hypothetical protein HELRODRAFT_178961 [Helobdella robusta]